MVGTIVGGISPALGGCATPTKEGMYTTLLMSTGLTFGTISSLFGLSHGIVTQGQYSVLVAAVIASAVVPTLIANIWFLPHHLLPKADQGDAGQAVSGHSASQAPRS